MHQSDAVTNRGVDGAGDGGGGGGCFATAISAVVCTVCIDNPCLKIKYASL